MESVFMFLQPLYKLFSERIQSNRTVDPKHNQNHRLHKLHNLLQMKHNFTSSFLKIRYNIKWQQQSQYLKTG